MPIRVNIAPAKPRSSRRPSSAALMRDRASRPIRRPSPHRRRHPPARRRDRCQAARAPRPSSRCRQGSALRLRRRARRRRRLPHRLGHGSQARRSPRQPWLGGPRCFGNLAMIGQAKHRLRDRADFPEKSPPAPAPSLRPWSDQDPRSETASRRRRNGRTTATSVLVPPPSMPRTRSITGHPQGSGARQDRRAALPLRRKPCIRHHMRAGAEPGDIMGRPSGRIYPHPSGSPPPSSGSASAR